MAARVTAGVTCGMRLTTVVGLVVLVAFVVALQSGPMRRSFRALDLGTDVPPLEGGQRFSTQFYLWTSDGADAYGSSAVGQCVVTPSSLELRVGRQRLVIFDRPSTVISEIGPRLAPRLRLESPAGRAHLRSIDHEKLLASLREMEWSVEARDGGG